MKNKHQVSRYATHDMRQSTILILVSCVVLLLSACKTQLVYVPVETLKTEKEYVDRWHRDSIYVKDSVFVAHKGDTVFIERYKYIYKDKFVRDSIFIRDSVCIEVPYPVEVVKTVNRVHNWQILLMVLGGAAIGFIGLKVFRRLK